MKIYVPLNSHENNKLPNQIIDTESVICGYVNQNNLNVQRKIHEFLVFVLFITSIKFHLITLYPLVAHTICEIAALYVYITIHTSSKITISIFQKNFRLIFVIKGEKKSR